MTTRAQRKLAELRLAEIREARQKRGRWFKRTGFAGKTFWDWLQLLSALAIPLVVAGATIGFGLLQQHLADVQHQQDQAIVLDQQRATILQTYFDNIQDLLLNHNLLRSQPGDDVTVLARARTLTALQGLDAVRKGQLLMFLYEADLIGFEDENAKEHSAIIDLSQADLSGADLSGDIIILSGIVLENADLTHVVLSGDDLYNADLLSADLSGAHLNRTILSGALLENANFSHADLSSTELYQADLVGANLAWANLDDSDLSSADLRGANLSETTLGVNLSGADLLEANLAGADLSKAVDLSQHQLDQVFSCEGAILPEGLTCHENIPPS